MRLILEIEDSDLVDKIVWLLQSLQSEGVKIINDNFQEDSLVKHEWDEEFVKKHWREIVMDTHSADLDDDERLYEAAARFYHEKHSD